MHRRIGTVEIVACAIMAAGCGRPRLKSVERHQATVDENTVTEQDARGDQQVVVVIHRDDCPADRLRMTAWTGSRETADCLRGLAVGSHLEMVSAIYQHPLMSCGVRASDPHSGIGPCSVEGVGFEQLGTRCPAP